MSDAIWSWISFTAAAFNAAISAAPSLIVATAAAQLPPIEYYWIGGTSDGTPGSWRWVDGTSFWQGPMTGDPVCGRYANWRGDAPSDPVITEPDQLCLYFTMDGWDDETCNVARMYVCEWY